jgi:exodeoxyribonuclease V alpha subunit
MTAHISVRLYWHDSGWNGAICRDPAGNTWCSAHGHVRTHKKVADEVRCAGQHAQDCGVLPACETNV